MRGETTDVGAVSPQPVLLGFLMRGPRHAYELSRVFDAELGQVWRVGRSHLYAHLGQLAAAGHATVRSESAGRRPARNVYSITPAGRAAFRAWLRQPSRHVRHMRLEFLARLYFYQRQEARGLERLIRRQKEVLASRMVAARNAIRRCGDAYERLVLEFRLAEMEAIDRWLDRCGPSA